MDRKYVNNPYSVTQKYIATRSAAFDIKGYQLGIKSEHTAQVYGVIVDMAISPNLLGTLICYINGAASVYFNNGGSVENIATNNIDVAKISQAFVVASQNAYDSAEKAVSYPVPTTKEHFVYLLTRGGIRKIVIDPETVDTNPVHKKLFVGYNTVMQVIQNAQLLRKKPSSNALNAGLKKTETVSDTETTPNVEITETVKEATAEKNETVKKTPAAKKPKTVKTAENNDIKDESTEKVKKPRAKKAKAETSPETEENNG